MRHSVGIDLVDVNEFRSMVKKGGMTFLRRCFHESELENKSVEHLAGIYAAKEAVIKALTLSAGSWKKIEIHKAESGRPYVFAVGGMEECDSISVSISHSGGHAVACAFRVES